MTEFDFALRPFASWVLPDIIKPRLMWCGVRRRWFCANRQGVASAPGFREAYVLWAGL